MYTHSLDLLFSGDPEAALPHNARSYISIKTRSVENGQVTISAECVTIQELEFEIERLRKELDEVLVKAKRKYSAYGKRQDEHFAKKQAL